MNAAPVMPPLISNWSHRFEHDRLLAVLAAVTGVGGLVAGACLEPRWLAAIAVALGLFFALKLLTLRGCPPNASRARMLAYLALWPGMNASTFLLRSAPPPARPGYAELGFALAKFAFGGALAAWAVAHAVDRDPRWVGWIGLPGLIFVFHFGILHVLSWTWRRAGVAAPLLMRAPVLARSLAEFWGERWNTAFSTLARRFVLRPLGRRWGVGAASGLIFLLSGIVHEVALSLPARGGWGGPTLYFLIQGLGAALEKRLGWTGRVWTLLITALPLPLLFHPPLVAHVVVPLFWFLKEVL
jgi:alginate O-acetyltransferase complex protein AlgI